ncbi:ATP-dependent nuclease [Desulfovibrio oxyclinae]|uniref:ATP-dependent nuclease n=1 Tax=Desulfovibrio oxyclinae TaxID=63560 RepID=UPI00036CB323|nr:AAA family ATPase [Desulfovibrio oxyclinae]
MHKITQITIRNYKSCQEVTVDLDDFTPLVGYNNAGKSNILRALLWAINPTKFTKVDCYDPDRPVEVECTIDGIEEEVFEGLGRHRAALEPLCQEGKITIKIEGKHGDIPSRFTRFAKNTDGEWVNPGGIKEAMNAFFPDAVVISAMEDATEDLSKNKSGTTLGKLLAWVIKPIMAEHEDSIAQALEQMNELLNAEGATRARELAEFDQEATRAIQDFFPGILLSIDVPPPSIETIFKSGIVRMGEKIPGQAQTLWRDVAAHGHGAQRAAHMALVKLLAEKNTTGTGRRLLLIDEPELYMHPQMVEQVRIALKNLSRNNYQVVFTTHSPLLVEERDVPKAVMVKKDSTTTSVRKTLDSCCRLFTQDKVAGARRELFELGNSAQLLFCDKALIAEGSTEKEILPDLLSHFLQTTFPNEKAALLNIRGCSGIPKTRKILDALSIPHKTIADLDFAFGSAGKDCQVAEYDRLVQESKAVIQSLSEKHGFRLNGEGRPQTKSSNMTAEEAYNLFATSDDGKDLVEEIHNRFLEKDVWLWPLGSIEYHLGMVEKGGAAVVRCCKQLESCSEEELIEQGMDSATICDALRWALDIV